MKCKSTLLLLLCSQLVTGIPHVQAQTPDSLRREKSHPIGAVVVTGTRNETDPRQLPLTLSVIDHEQLQQNNQPSLLPALVDHVPGLFVTERGIMGYGVAAGAAGGMTMRGIGGSPTTGMLVLIDGHPQYMGLMGHPIADAYQTMMAEQVEVVRGPASVLYGSNAMGGVINIVTRKMKSDGVNTNLSAGYGSYNTFQSEASNTIRSGRFSSVVTGSYNRTDGHRHDMGFEQYGGYAKLGYELSKAWGISADVNLTHFNAQNPGSVTHPILDNKFRITRGMTSFFLENNYAKTSGALSIFYNWGRHKINDGYSAGQEPPVKRFNSRDYMFGISWYQSFVLFSGNRTTMGIDYQRFGGRSWNRFINGKPDKEMADVTQNEVAAYLDIRQALTRWMILDAGLRIDHHSHVGTEWIPQGGISFLLSRSAQLKAMVSKGFRFPTIREMYMFPPQNPDLKPENLMNYEISFSQTLLGGNLRYGVNLFYISGDNMIQTVPVDGRPMNINTGEIENWGVEADITYRINSHWTLSSNYSYLNMSHPVVAAPEHKLYTGMIFKAGRWDVSTGIRYVRGLYTSVKPRVQEQFVLWNANAEFMATRWLSLYVRGENLLARNYEINAGYPMPKATVLGGFKINF